MVRRGEIFAGYRIDREVGRGGMGAVYVARDPRLPRWIALKLLHREMFGDTETRFRFEREADVIAQLEHPNVITVHDRGCEDDQLWIAMQFVDGTDCHSLDPREVSPERAVQIIMQTAAALDYAHGKGILHRDVKPANILLSPTAGVGFSERALLSDFGIARVLGETAHQRLTATGKLNATLAYASPEQLTAEQLDHRSDQYSLACTLFRLLTGQAPFESPMVGAVVLGHIQGRPPAVSSMRSGLPRRLDAVLARALAKKPQDRYASCAEFAAAAWEAVTVGDQAFASVQALVRGEPPADDELRMAGGPLAGVDEAPGDAEEPIVAPAHPSRLDRVHGCLLGGAVGDALGAQVETMLLRNIQQRYGIRGFSGEPDQYRGRISDETQMTLFATEALIRSSVRARASTRAQARGVGVAAAGLMQEGLLVWMQGQGVTVPEQPYPLHSNLTMYPELMTNRGPTHTTVSAMERVAALRHPGRPLGTRGQPINDSKACAAVVRVAPFGFGGSPAEVFESACDAAALTHGNPGGWLPAGTFAATIFGLSEGLELRAALSRARTELVRHDGHEETSEALDRAISLAGDTAKSGGEMPEPESLEPLGYGVIGPEALAIAVFSALCAEIVGGGAEQVFRNGVLLSINHSGDSDATGSLCGALLGARYGVPAIPGPWGSRLDAAAVIERLSADFCREFGDDPPGDKDGAPTDEWWRRYPG
ncbi:ADP-ribosylglycohydrolase family protein [Nocardia huaxiensis]|nr:ADP-ribosylglycohydrolase family protein [Nocardia huaxiensis]